MESHLYKFKPFILIFFGNLRPLFAQFFYVSYFFCHILIIFKLNVGIKENFVLQKICCVSVTKV